MDSREKLFTILADYVNDRPSTCEVDADIVRLAKIHKLDAIVYSQTKAPELKQSFLARWFGYTKLKNVLDSVEERLVDIPHFIVKGPCLAEYYAEPYHRTMGDIDIIIGSKSRKKVDRIFADMGFSRGYGYYLNGVEIELHSQLIYPGNIDGKEAARYFNDFGEYLINGKADPSFHFLFVIAHLKKHLTHSGAGIRQFLDVALLVKKEKALDWDYISEKAKEVRLYDFLMSCMYLCRRWFDVQPPIDGCEMSEEAYEYLTDAIVKNGVFGFSNPEYGKKNRSVKADNKTTAEKIGGKITRFFPRYESMKSIPYYGFIDGKPYLLPVAWVVRAVRGVTEKKSVFAPTVDRVEGSDSHADFMEQIGLR